MQQEPAAYEPANARLISIRRTTNHSPLLRTNTYTARKPDMPTPVSQHGREDGAAIDTARQAHDTASASFPSTAVIDSPPSLSVGTGSESPLHQDLTRDVTTHGGHLSAAEHAQALRDTPNLLMYAEHISSELSHSELCQYIENSGCSTETLAAVIKQRLDGVHWRGIWRSPHCETIMRDDLHITSPLLFVKLQSEHERREEARTVAKLTASTTSEGAETKPNITEPGNAMLGSNNTDNHTKIGIPCPPPAAEWGSYPSPAKWKQFGVACYGWADCYSTQLADIINKIFWDPNLDLAKAYHQLSSQDQLLDKIWAAKMLQDPRGYVASQTTMSSSCQIDGHNSGLQIAASVGKFINKRMPERAAQALSLTLTQEPVKVPQLLHERLMTLHQAWEFIAQQGKQVDDLCKYAAMIRAVSVLTARPDMQAILGAPIAALEAQQEGNADALWQLLLTKAENIKVRYPEANLCAAAVGHTGTGTHGTGTKKCPWYRDTGKCNSRSFKLKGKCDFEHVKSNGVECNRPSYLKMGLCDQFWICDCYHAPYKPSKWGNEPLTYALHKLATEYRIEGFDAELPPKVGSVSGAAEPCKCHQPPTAARGGLLDKSKVGELPAVADGGTGASKAAPAKKSM